MKLRIALYYKANNDIYIALRQQTRGLVDEIIARQVPQKEYLRVKDRITTDLQFLNLLAVQLNDDT